MPVLSLQAGGFVVLGRGTSAEEHSDLILQTTNFMINKKCANLSEALLIQKPG